MTTTEDSGRVAWLRQARAHLHAADPVLARLIDERPDFDPRGWKARFRPPMSRYDAAPAAPAAPLESPPE